MIYYRSKRALRKSQVSGRLRREFVGRINPPPIDSEWTTVSLLVISSRERMEDGMRRVRMARRRTSTAPVKVAVGILALITLSVLLINQYVLHAQSDATTPAAPGQISKPFMSGSIMSSSTNSIGS